MWPCLQYRNKAASADLRRRQAEALASLCATARCPLVINDDVALAMDVAADGVHLGEHDAGSARGARLAGASPDRRRVLLRQPGTRRSRGRGGR